MDIVRKEVRLYINRWGEIPFNGWRYALKDTRAQSAVRSRLERLAVGSLGDFKIVGQGVVELRIHLSPGYRIYVGLKGRLAVVLLGGVKDTQPRDIKSANFFWRDYLYNEN